jgi:hypothetical protein
MEVDAAGSGSCPVADFGVSSFETSVSATRGLLNELLIHLGLRQFLRYWLRQSASTNIHSV